MRPEPAAGRCDHAFAGHRGCDSTGYNRAKLSGVRDPDHGVLLPSDRNSGHRVRRTGKWQIAGRRSRGSTARFEKREDLVLGLVRGWPGGYLALHAGDRSWSHPADRQALTMAISSKQWQLTTGVGTCLAGVIVLRIFDPATSGAFPPCPVHYLTGWYCPGCGSLRALHQLLHGNLRAAWAMNPLTVILLPFLTYGLASRLVAETYGKGL